MSANTLSLHQTLFSSLFATAADELGSQKILDPATMDQLVQICFELANRAALTYDGIARNYKAQADNANAAAAQQRALDDERARIVTQERESKIQMSRVEAHMGIARASNWFPGEPGKLKAWEAELAAILPPGAQNAGSVAAGPIPVAAPIAPAAKGAKS